MTFQLEKVLGDDVNLVEVYFALGPGTSQRIQVKSPNIAGKVLGKGAPSTYIQYYHKDMCYSYDTTNDNQRVTRKIPIAHSQYNNLHVFAYQEETLPSHRFPCTNDIDHKERVTKTSYRVSNRITVVYDNTNEVLSVVYKHAPMVDTKKMSEEMMNLLSKLQRA